MLNFQVSLFADSKTCSVAESLQQVMSWIYSAWESCLVTFIVFGFMLFCKELRLFVDFSFDRYWRIFSFSVSPFL